MKHYLPFVFKSNGAKPCYRTCLVGSSLSIITLLWLHHSFLAQIEQPYALVDDYLPHILYLPLVHAAADALPVAPLLEWDPRLTERGAVLVAAQVAPGEGYWQLIKARWFDPKEAQGRHHIYIDLLDDQGQRSSNLAVTIEWADGAATVITEPKPDEPYATNYAMYALAPAYSAQPSTDAPADRVEGMGLGTIDEPNLAFHTSYGLVWQWAIANETLVNTPTATVPITATLEISRMATPTWTVSITPSLVPAAILSTTATPSMTQTLTPAPEL